MYHLNENYLGTYPNFDTENSGILLEWISFAHFGLEEYESRFQHHIAEWIGSLKIDEEADCLKDIFYFCHVSTT
jgi:hypothetical protein